MPTQPSPILSPAYISALDAGKQSRVAAIGLLIYDHLTSIDQEVELVWTKGKRHPAFYLYIANRWFAFLYYLWDTIPLTPSGVVASKTCVIYLMCDAMATLVATVLVQVFLQFRIYALYERSRRILVLLLTLSAIEVAAMAVLVGVTMSRLERLPLVSTPTGCSYQGLLEIYALFWIPGLIYEPVLFGLVAIKVSKDNVRVKLISEVARGSLIYFLAIFVQLLVNTVVWARYPEYINIFNPWSAALPSLLGSRLFLGTRSLVQRQGGSSYIHETYAPSNSLSEVEEAGGERTAFSSILLEET